MNSKSYNKTNIFPHDHLDRSNWKRVRLGDVVGTFIRGVSYDGETDVFSSANNESIELLRANNIIANRLVTLDTLYIRASRVKAQQILQDNDILVCMANGSKSLVGKSAIFHSQGKQYTFGAFMGVFRCHKKEDALFVSYLLQTDMFRNSVDLILAGSSINNLTPSSLMSLEFFFPPSSYRHRIAEALSSVDTHISALHALISKYEAIKNATVSALLKPKEGWKRVKLGDAFTFGNGYTPSKAVKQYWENGTIPWFRMEDIRKNGRVLKDSIQHITKEAIKGNSLFPAGSFILSTTATLGEYALLIADSLANQQFTFLVKNVNRNYQIDTMWFLQYLAIIGEWCRKCANAGGLLAVNMNDLYNYEIPLPPIDEQKRVVTILDSIDDTISGLKAQLTKSQALKQGMMTYFFG